LLSLGGAPPAEDRKNIVAERITVTERITLKDKAGNERARFFVSNNDDVIFNMFDSKGRPWIGMSVNSFGGSGMRFSCKGVDGGLYLTVEEEGQPTIFFSKHMTPKLKLGIEDDEPYIEILDKTLKPVFRAPAR
jgi:hypothetical protein